MYLLLELSELLLMNNRRFIRCYYIVLQFKSIYKDTFKEDSKFAFVEGRPIIKQISIYLRQKRKFSEWDMHLFKKHISENFKPNKSSLKTKNPLLNNLAEEIIKILDK